LPNILRILLQPVRYLKYNFPSYELSTYYCYTPPRSHITTLSSLSNAIAAAASASTKKRRHHLVMPQRHCSYICRATSPLLSNSTAMLQPQAQPHLQNNTTAVKQCYSDIAKYPTDTFATSTLLVI
jgi:hypothetical protein